MAAENGGGLGGFNYQWASNGHPQWAPWPTEESLVPTFSLSNAVAHPLDGTAYVIKADQSQSLNLYGWPNPWNIPLTPASAKRWGWRTMGFFYKDGNPTSAAPIFSAFGRDLELQVNTDGTVSVWYMDSGGNSILLATSAKVLLNSTWYLIEIWAIGKDSTGTALPGSVTEIYVRIHESFSTGAPPGLTTEICHAYVTMGSNAPLPPTTVLLSNADNNTHGSVNFYFANPYACWEDADNPYGVIRIYYPTMSGTGTLNPAAWTNAYTEWDDSPSSAAVDTDTRNNATASAAGTANGKATSKLTGVPTSDISSSDFVIGVSVSVRCGGINLGKAGSAFDTAMLKTSGGTETVASQYDTHSSNSPASGSWFFKDKPGGTGWANTDIGTADGTLEVGLDGYSNNTAGGTVITCSALTAEYVWSKNGETIAAVPIGTVRRRGVVN